MSLEIDVTVNINNDFRNLIHNGNYEKIILNIMNSSKKLFPNTYKHIKNQSHGECDFIDEKTSKKYDAKLPFSNSDGILIGSDNFDFVKWLELMHKRIEECQKIYIDDNYSIEDSQLYRIIERIIKKVELEEQIILFFPYPIILDGANMFFSQFKKSILSSIYDALENNNLIKGRSIYTIFLGIDGEIVIRCLNNRKYECIPNLELNKYIDFVFKTIEVNNTNLEE